MPSFILSFRQFLEMILPDSLEEHDATVSKGEGAFINLRLPEII